MIEPFKGPLAKLQRGTYHAHRLGECISDYLARRPIYRSAAPLPENPRYYKSYIVVREPPPLELGLIFGDAIHNMRACLDLLANDLVRIAGKTTRGVCFPFANSAADLGEKIKSSHISRAGPDVVELVRTLAPYPEGNPYLKSLHDLDIKDKHQMLMPTLATISGPSGGFGINTLEDFPREMGPTVYLAEAFGPEGLAIGSELPVKFQLFFFIGEPFDGQQVVPTLIKIGEYLLEVLKEFAAIRGRSLEG